MNLIDIKSRSKLDTALFSFGDFDQDGDLCNGYKVFCAGEGTSRIERFMPLKGEELDKLISKFSALERNDFKGKIKLKCGWFSINFLFSGLNSSQGIKVKSYITGFFFYSSSLGSSYVCPNQLSVLASNLRRCL